MSWAAQQIADWKVFRCAVAAFPAAGEQIVR